LSLFRSSLLIPLLVSLGCSGSAGDDDSSTGADDGGGKGGASSGGAGGSGGTSSAGKGGSAAQGGSALAAGSPSASSGGSGEAGESASGKGGTTGGGAGESGSGASGGTGGTGTGGGAGQIGNHTNPLSQALIDAFVAAHNAARARTDLEPPPNPALPPVTWDAMLADAAYNYLSGCEVDGEGNLVDHNDDRTKDYAALGGTDYVGENIFASTGSSVQPSDALDSWMSEKDAYDYAKNNVDKAGHYTQVVWRDSVRIGCAIVNCPNARFSNTVLCDYAPGGNISGQKPY
jgi:pathogenesis-related protein 1